MVRLRFCAPLLVCLLLVGTPAAGAITVGPEQRPGDPAHVPAYLFPRALSNGSHFLIAFGSQYGVSYRILYRTDTTPLTYERAEILGLSTDGDQWAVAWSNGIELGVTIVDADGRSRASGKVSMPASAGSIRIASVRGAHLLTWREGTDVLKGMILNADASIRVAPFTIAPRAPLYSFPAVVAGSRSFHVLYAGGCETCLFAQELTTHGTASAPRRLGSLRGRSDAWLEVAGRGNDAVLLWNGEEATFAAPLDLAEGKQGETVKVAERVMTSADRFFGTAPRPPAVSANGDGVLVQLVEPDDRLGVIRLDLRAKALDPRPVRVAEAHHFRRVSVAGDGRSHLAAVQPVNAPGYAVFLYSTLHPSGPQLSIAQRHAHYQYDPEVLRAGSTLLTSWRTDFGDGPRFWSRMNDPQSFEARGGRRASDFVAASNGRQFFFAESQWPKSYDYRLEVLDETGPPRVAWITLPGTTLRSLIGAFWDGAHFVVMWQSWRPSTCAPSATTIYYARVTVDGRVLDPDGQQLALGHEDVYAAQAVPTGRGLLLAYTTRAERLADGTCKERNTLRLASFDRELRLVHDELVETLGGWWDRPISTTSDGAGTNVILFRNSYRSGSSRVDVRRVVAAGDDARLIQPPETTAFQTVAWTGHSFLFARADGHDVVVARWNAGAFAAAPSWVLFSAPQRLTEVRLAPGGDAIAYDAIPAGNFISTSVVARTLDDEVRRRRAVRK